MSEIRANANKQSEYISEAKHLSSRDFWYLVMSIKQDSP